MCSRWCNMDNTVIKIKDSKKRRPVDDDTQSDSGVLDKDVAICKLIKLLNIYKQRRAKLF